MYHTKLWYIFRPLLDLQSVRIFFGVVVQSSLQRLSVSIARASGAWWVTSEITIHKSIHITRFMIQDWPPYVSFRRSFSPGAQQQQQKQWQRRCWPFVPLSPTAKGEIKSHAHINSRYNVDYNDSYFSHLVAAVQRTARVNELSRWAETMMMTGCCGGPQAHRTQNKRSYSSRIT